MAATILGKAVWVSWERQRRNRTLSAALGASLYELNTRLPRVLRYILLPWATLLLFIRHKPDYIFAQNPSLALALFAALYGRATATPTIIDAHNAGLFPLEGRSERLNRLARFIIRKATVTIVSNDGLTETVRNAGGTPFVLPDPLPSFSVAISRREEPTADRKGRILFICTWAKDEPYLEVLEASRQLDLSISLVVTGNFRNVRCEALSALPCNVTLLGYVTDTQFQQELADSDIIMDLTTRDNCLVCGAYEAVALGKPLITSDTAALRSYFYKGAVYTKPDPAAIAEAILEALGKRDELAKEVGELKSELISSFEERKLEFLRLMEKLANDVPAR